MRIVKLIIAALAFAVITGCAHPIVISPDVSNLERNKRAQPIAKNVAYYISPEARAKAVETPGGGGDKVSYFPYKDIETSFYKMLSNVFNNVTLLNSPNDVAAINKQAIKYVITPDITTDSSSPSPFTWPPTKFTMNLTCKISDASGKLVSSIVVVGEGNAEFDEFKSDFALSAKRASLDALTKMQARLLEAPELKK
ncbi:MAG TPA: hypothetical protein VJ396_04300 [Acidiferrobacterales bacterium]|nr:hypothetical protein [Acidiferrobacterales bacterium]